MREYLISGEAFMAVRKTSQRGKNRFKVEQGSQPEVSPIVKAESNAIQSPAVKALRRATIRFGPDWAHSCQGELVAGGSVIIEYDPARAQMREVKDGVPSWGVQGFVKFMPAGEVVEAPVIEFPDGPGPVAPNPQISKLAVAVPEGATEVQVWFRNWTGAAGGREIWDSDFGKNYRFQVKNNA
jgi:hypothetical protein